jgi:PRTRC genetic system protein C
MSAADNLTVTAAERVFTYNGMTLPDPSPGLSVEQVRDIYASQHPDLATASYKGPTEVGGKLEYAFTRAIGTKG